MAPKNLALTITCISKRSPDYAHPQNRTLILKRFKDIADLRNQIRDYYYYLQSCSFLAEGDDKKALLSNLGAIGVKRFAPLGTIMTGLAAAPHDGRHCLRDLVHLVADESEEDIGEFLSITATTVPFYRNRITPRPDLSLNDFPIIGSDDLIQNPITSSSGPLSPDANSGFIFSSGGTSGSPKYSFFSYSEFAETAQMLAHGFILNGISKGMKVANLFVAGNMWSSFMAIDRALEITGAIQLPIGGLANPKSIVNWLETFKPDAVCGLPSLLTDLARIGRELKAELKIPKVFFAGEHLSANARTYLHECWQTSNFHSAGYASVDVGPIGWQCQHCLFGEHHLFEPFIHMEVIEGEAVVTSRLRNSMPIVRYRTGDLVKILPPTPSCPCGSSAPKFRLLGRTNGIMNIWSCHVPSSDIENALQAAEITYQNMQIQLSDQKVGQHYEEQLTVLIESADEREPDGNRFRQALWSLSQDIRQTHPLEYLEPRLRLQQVVRLDRVERTGKVQSVIDNRHI